MEQKISRRDLFDDPINETNSFDKEFSRPKLEFVEINTNDTIQNQTDDQQDEPMMFNLFGNTQEIDLKEDISEAIKQSRPSSYYFDRPDDTDRLKYQQMAVTGHDILSKSQQIYYGMKMDWKVIDYTELAIKTRKEMRKKRPGKKAREARKDRKLTRKPLSRNSNSRKYKSKATVYHKK